MGEVPYYKFEGDESKLMDGHGEPYIDDDDLKKLLLDLLGDKVSEAEIQKILTAASDENLTEEDFDRMIDEFILKNKS